MAEHRSEEMIWLSISCKGHASLRTSAQQSASARRRRCHYAFRDKLQFMSRNWSKMISHPQSLIPSQITTRVSESIALGAADRNHDGARTQQNLAVPFEGLSCWELSEQIFHLQCEVILDRVAALCKVMYGRARVRR